MADLNSSLSQYKEQLTLVEEALKTADAESRDSLLTLQNDLNQLIYLTKESIDTESDSNKIENAESQPKTEIDDEYALFMQEMAKSGAYEDKPEDSSEQPSCSKTSGNQNDIEKDSDIEEELSTLLGMKCAVYHTHRWGGEPTLHNAMVSAVVPRQDDDQFQDLQVRVLFTHPTHAEMLPCPFFLDGECKFDDEKCRYSHGAVVPLSHLKEAIEPNFAGIREGSRILMKIKPPDDEDISMTKKSTEKYHLWHRAIVHDIDVEKRVCIAKVEQGAKSGDKRKTGYDEVQVKFEEIFPLNVDDGDSSDSSDSLSDTEYPECKVVKQDDTKQLLVEKSLQYNGPAMGEWEQHTRGIGSKLMLCMGYVWGAGLGAAGAGRVAPLTAQPLPTRRGLDAAFAAQADGNNVEQKLKKIQKREEERAYEREKEREKRNVFNFINKTLGNKPDDEHTSTKDTIDIKQTTNKNLNIENFKIMEETKKLEREIIKLNSSLSKYPTGSPGHIAISNQLTERNKDLTNLKHKEQQISKEQRHRKDKQKMTVF